MNELREILVVRTGPLVGQVYCPFLWSHWATGWYTLRALETRTIVLTDRREHEEEWPWPPEFLVEWDFEGHAPSELADVELFHLHNGWTASSRGLELIETLPDKPYVASFIGTDVNRHAALDENSEKYTRLFEVIEAAIVPCEFLAQKLTNLGCDRSKVRVIPWGVEPSVLPRKDAGGFSPTGALKVCMVARMIELKGVDVAIEGVGLASETADVTLDIVGNGPERARLVALAEEVNVRSGADVVRICGDGDGLPPHRYAMDVLSQSDCLVNCSKRMPDGSEETMSIAMIEAQMMGLPVIAFWCGGAAEIVEHGKTGWLAISPDGEHAGSYEEATPKGLAQALVRLAEDRESRIRMGSSAAKRARSLFATDVVARAHDRLYRELLGLRSIP